MHTRVVVIGGGFAGVQAVRALRRRLRSAEITLIDRTGMATMLPALPDILSGRVERAALSRALPEIFPKGVAHLKAMVTGIQLDRRTVVTDAGEIAYDGLVIAAGSTPRWFGTPLEGAFTADTLAGVTALREALSSRARPDLVVVGGGYTGLEVAVSARLGFGARPEGPRITVVDPAEELMTIVPERPRARLRAQLEALDLEMRTGTTLSQLDAGAATALLSDGTTLENVVVCWTPGMQAATIPIVSQRPLARTSDGRVIVTQTLQLPGYPEVSVGGDMAALGVWALPDGTLVREDGGASAGSSGGASPPPALRRAVNFAFYSGRSAGRSVASHLTGRAAPPFRPLDLGWVLPLGTTSYGRIFGVIQVGGRFGLRLHYLMSGFRHVGVGHALTMYLTAMHLRRRPERPEAPARPEQPEAPKHPERPS